mgnify:CR=1 FL=1
MKRIEFGFANEMNPRGSWEGIGIKPGVMLTEADYYGAVKYDSDSYVVAKVTSDEYGNCPNLLGNFIVRPAIADLYPDGSGIIFLDQEESSISQQIEASLNRSYVKNEISDIKDVYRYCNGVTQCDKSFLLLTMDDNFMVTSILHEVFERKNNALKSCHDTFSQLQEQVTNVEQQYKRY